MNNIVLMKNCHDCGLMILADVTVCPYCARGYKEYGGKRMNIKIKDNETLKMNYFTKEELDLFNLIKKN